MSSSPRPLGARKKNNIIEHSPIRSGYFVTEDGTKLFYSVEGNENGEPLVFCYGLICSILHWTYQIDYFKKNYKIYWMDYRGHQASELPKEINSVTIHQLAEDLNSFFTEAKIKNATILGHSMGVNIALEFYKKYPEKVRALVISNGTPHRPLESLLLNNTFEPAFNFLTWVGKRQPKILNFFWKSQKANPLIYKLIGFLGFNEKQTPKEDIKQYVDQFADLDPQLFLKLIRNYNDYDCSPWLHEINIPTLIIAGEKDYIIPKHQQELFHQLIPNSELQLIENGSHCPQMDQPEKISEIIELFLEKHSL